MIFLVAAPPTRPRKPIGGTDAFRNTMNAVLRRAKDGEGQASAVEPIFGNLIDSLHMKALTKLLAKMPAGATGVESESQLCKSKTTFLPDLI